LPSRWRCRRRSICRWNNWWDVSSIQLKQSDQQVAEYVKKIKRSNRLDERVIEELQGQGLGPKTVEALHGLSEASAKLPAAPPPAPKPVIVLIPPPSPEERKKALDTATDHALNHLKPLPDFLCTQVTRRFADPTGKESWIPQDGGLYQGATGTSVGRCCRILR